MPTGDVDDPVQHNFPSGVGPVGRLPGPVNVGPAEVGPDCPAGLGRPSGLSYRTEIMRGVINDADGAVAAIAARQHGAFTRSQAASAKLDKKAIARRLEAKVLSEPFPGVLVANTHPTTYHQRVMVAILAGGGAFAASHRCAATLHRLDGFALDELTPIEITTTSSRSRIRDARVHRARTLDKCDTTSVSGIVTTNLARTLVDLASVCEPIQVERALDDVRRRGKSIRWIKETTTRLHRPGQKGTKVLLNLIAGIEADPILRDSWFEKLVERCMESPYLRRLGVVRQHPIREHTGRVLARTDLAIPRVKLAVEAHSRAFHFGRRLEAADEDRDLRLAAVGWETLYIGYRYTERPSVVGAAIEAIARMRATQLGIPA